MHRSTQKNPSKVCQARNDERNAKIHKDKLASMKPSIDNTPPKAQIHLEHRRKKEQQAEERLSTIEKDNLILLNKMKEIMQSPSTAIPHTAPVAAPKSLNRNYRKKQLDEINDQNQALLKRLQSAKAYYDHADWDKFGATQESYLKNICEYPVVKNATKKPGDTMGSTTGTTKSNGSPQKDKTKTSTQKSALAATNSPLKPKANLTAKGAAGGGKKKKVGEKTNNKKQESSDNDSLQLSDLDDSDIDDIATGTNLDVNKGDFSKLDGGEEDAKEDAGGADDAEDLGSEFSDDSLDLDDEEGGDGTVSGTHDGKETSSSVTKSRTAKSKKSTVSSLRTGTKEDGTEYTEADKATIESSEKHEEFDKDTEAYKPQEDEEEEGDD